MPQMKLANRDILAGYEAILHLNMAELGVKAGYGIAKTTKALEKARTDIEEYRQKLLKEHANLNEDGQPKTKEQEGAVVFDLEDEAAFRAAWQELLDEETEVQIHQVSLDAMGDVKIKPGLIMPLMDFLFKDEA